MKIKAIVAVVMLLLLTAFITYRITMRSISIEVCGDTAYLTAYGLTDEYDIGQG